MKIKHIISFLIAAIFFFASWTDAFSFFAWISIPIVLSCVFIIITFIIQGKNAFQFNSDSDKISFLLISLLLISAAYNSNASSTNYIFTYIFAFIFLNIYLRNGIVRYGNYGTIKIANIVSVLFIATFIYLDFYFEFFLGNSLQIYLSRSVEPIATYFIFPRAYAFSEEPTYLGWYLNTLGIMALYHGFQYLKHHNYLKLLLIVYFFGSWVLTFSAATFAFLPFAFCLVWVIFLLKNKGKVHINFKRIFVYLVTVVCLVYILVGVIELRILSSFFEGMIDKISFNSTGDNVRSIRLSSDLGIAFQNILLGKGPGYFASLDQGSSLNLFLFITLEAGIGAFLLLIAFYATKFKDIILSNSQESFIYAVTFVAGVAHLSTMTQYYHLNIWLLLSMFHLSLNSNKDRTTI